MPGIEPGAFHMQSERSTTEPHPHIFTTGNRMKFCLELFIYGCYFSFCFIKFVITFETVYSYGWVPVIFL